MVAGWMISAAARAVAHGVEIVEMSCVHVMY